MAALVTGASQLLASALSQSTINTYQRAWDKFAIFTRSVLNIQPLPALPSTIALYISSLVSVPINASPATVATIISAIGYRHKLLGYQDPTSAFIIRKIIHGVTKSKPAADLRVPITPNMLSAILVSSYSTATTAYERVLMPAMFVTMFHAFMRIGEVTHSPHNIQYHQVVLSLNAVSITFVSFKHHHGQPITIDIPAASHNNCPVKILASYIQTRGSRPGPFFCNMNNTPISPSQFRTFLKKAQAHAGLSSCHITPHSFRIGAATYAATLGLSSPQIQAMGRWKSEAFQKYVRISSISLPSTGQANST